MRQSPGIELLKDVKIFILHALFKKGYDLQLADDVAEAVRSEIHTKFSKSLYYIPNLKSVSPLITRGRIISLFNEGKSATEIVKLTGMASSTVYRYIRSRNRPDKSLERRPAPVMGVFIELKMHAGRALLQGGVTPEDCKEICEGMQDFICKTWGGVNVSFPVVGRTQERNDCIMADRNRGLSYDELAAKYSMRREQVKGVVKRMS